MPMSPTTASLISTGAGLFSNVFNAVAQGTVNRAERRYNTQMYERQRRDSLADWTMQNEYNSPQAQMARLKAAGLNPNLVYGHGTVAGDAGAVRSTSAPSWNPQAPQIDLSSVANSGLSAYMDYQLKEAQLDNLKAQNSVILQDTALKAAQIQGVYAGVDKTKADTMRSQIAASLSSDLYVTSLEAAKASLAKTVASTQYVIDENERRAAMQQPNITLALEKILTMRLERAKTAEQIYQIRQAIKNLQADEALKQLDINLRKNGINPSDPVYMRIIGQWLNGIDKSFGQEKMFSEPGSYNKFIEGGSSSILNYVPKYKK